MASLRISLVNAIFTALVLVSCVTAITDTVTSYAEQAASSLADMAHMRGSELEIRSNDPEWYGDGMRIFAFGHLPFFWEKRHLKWALMNDPVVMTAATVIVAMDAGFRKWAKVSPFTFQRVSPSEQPDIRIEFIPAGGGTDARMIDPEVYKMDDVGVTIQFSTTDKWIGDRNRSSWSNFRFVALYKIGHALGLADSYVYGAVMYREKGKSHPGVALFHDYCLTDDDIEGIQAKYGPPPVPEKTPQTDAIRQPTVPSSSSSSSSSNSSKSKSSNSSSDDDESRIFK